MKFSKLTWVIIFAAFGCLSVSADEGMWPVSNIDSRLYQKLKESGLQLPVEALYSDTKVSLKDAIVLFDNGCSAGVVSENGLIFTNHHCARDRAQQISTPEHNYVQNGYWANNLNEEIPIKGLNVKFLIKSIDVTDSARIMLAKNSIKKVQYTYESRFNDTALGIEASLDVYSTGKYILSVYRVFNDVRLVGIPPESVGNFGGETDNFEWPRQSADFAVFRIYAGKDNIPSKYSADNKPYRPVTFLPLSLNGVHEGDYTMALGFPFSTQRNINSFELDELLNVKNKATMITKGKYIEVLKDELENHEDVRLKYSSKNFSAGNSQKLAEGFVKYVSLSPATEIKKKQEEDFQRWADSDSTRKTKYGKVLEILKNNYDEQRVPKYAHAIIIGSLFSDASLFGIRTRQVVEAYAKNDTAIFNNSVADFKQWYSGFMKNYDVATDRKIVRAMLKLVKEQVDSKYLPDLFSVIQSSYKGDIDAYVNDMYAKTFLTDKDKVERFLKKPLLKTAQNDMFYNFGISLYEKMIELKKVTNDNGNEIRNARRLYTSGMLLKNAGQLTAPDANFSMRLTYGKVAGAEPRDGIIYKSQTTLAGVMEKEDTTNYQFYVWPKLKTLFKNKDLGRYGENGKQYTCFLTSNDVTGGNSGSPLINGKGELIGLVFDGNRESLASDVIYEQDKNRTINVDVRYILFIIDKFAENKYILDELTIK